MNRPAFFAAVRSAFGPLAATQVAGFTLILDQAERVKTPLDHLAYMLATTYWETGRTMQPVAEANWVKNAEAWRKTHLRYWPYYGRGYVQLTWDYNYKKATDYFRNVLKVNVDFVKNPELVMRPEYAVVILFVGMEQGWFTGKKLADYMDGIDEGDVEDLREMLEARRIINGVDKKVEIGKIGLVFEQALRASGYGK
ncbi:carboxypeptidase [Mesorhizobium sp. M1380]|uniref:carboxypeptidase n=1 Tax=Mesorhizobium sp. M1380 TaxID=2957093 RepID=UPI00333DD06D